MMLEWIEFKDLNLGLADLQDDFRAAVPLTDESGVVIVDWADSRESPLMICVDADWEEKLNCGFTETQTVHMVTMTQPKIEKLIAYLEVMS